MQILVHIVDHRTLWQQGQTSSTCPAKYKKAEEPSAVALQCSDRIVRASRGSSLPHCYGGPEGPLWVIRRLGGTTRWFPLAPRFRLTALQSHRGRTALASLQSCESREVSAAKNLLGVSRLCSHRLTTVLETSWAPQVGRSATTTPPRIAPPCSF